MFPTPADSPQVPLRYWIFGVGGAGFLAGFLGPIVLAPGSNQGPLVGIFLSGPAGLALGLLCWIACRLLRVSSIAQWRTLWISAGGLALLTVVFVLLNRH